MNVSINGANRHASIKRKIKCIITPKFNDGIMTGRLLKCGILRRRNKKVKKTSINKRRKVTDKTNQTGFIF